jgi:hypothetical protein
MGNRVNARETVLEILRFARDRRGVRFEIGRVSEALAVVIPSEEVRDITVGEALSRVLRWFPAMCVSFDYSGEVPVLNITGLGESGVVSYRIGVDTVNVPDLSPRFDLRPECVVVQYTYENQQVDAEGRSNTYLSEFVDKWPLEKSGKELGAVRFTVPMEGSRSTAMRQRVEVEDVKSESVGWWLRHCPFFRDARFKRMPPADGGTPEPISVVKGSGGVMDEEGLKLSEGAFGDLYVSPEETPRMMRKGGVAEWMTDEAAGGEQKEVKEAAGTVFARLNWVEEIKDEYGKVSHYKEVRDYEMELKVTLTNAKSRVYSQNRVEQVAEALPVGLARRFYEEAAYLRHDGQVVLTVADVVDVPVVGMRVNLSGGRAEWAQMGAVVQGVGVDLDGGRVTLSLGSPAWLAPPDWISFYRQNRGRSDGAAVAWLRAKGKVDGEGERDIPAAVLNAPPAGGVGRPVVNQLAHVVVRDVEAASDGSDVPERHKRVALRVDGRAGENVAIRIRPEDIKKDMWVQAVDIPQVSVMSGGGLGLEGYRRAYFIVSDWEDVPV